MAGKRTDLGDRHQSRSGVTGLHQDRPTDHREGQAWVRLAEVGSDGAARAIAEHLPQSLGRRRGQLTDDEAFSIAEMLWHWRGLMAATHRHRVSRQDQLRTLRGIATSKEDESVLASYRRCDASTRAEVQESLRMASEERLPASHVGLCEQAIDAFRQSRMRIFRGLEKDPHALRESARSAAERLSSIPAQGGRPPNDYQRGFASVCLLLWQQMGGDPMAAIWHYDCSNSQPSPLLQFAGVLFDALEGKDGFDLAKVKRLLVEARAAGKVSAPS